MAKITGVLKGAKGKLAGFTLQKGANGNTIMRETVTPKNPNTELQKVQRAVIGTVGKAYSAMKLICDHSFEGYSNGAANMNRFRSLNSNKLRAFAAAEIEEGTEMAVIYDFNSAKLALNEYIMSEGSLPRVNCSYGGDPRRYGVVLSGVEFNPDPDGGAAPIIPTYADICNATGLKRGDQLTLCFMYRDQFSEKGFNFTFARIILSPVLNGDLAPMTTPFFTIEGSIEINAANPRNEGTSKLRIDGFNSNLSFTLISDVGSVYGGTIIASRKVNNSWLRSPSVMAISDFSDGNIHKVSLLDAINKGNNISLENNTLYLNNATD